MTDKPSNNVDHAIGIFDSGFGGLTVMREVMHVLPHEDIVYFGDTARLPYGDKAPETIVRYSIENAIFLLDQRIKILLIACNTATSYALDKLKLLLNIPVIGVIEPGAEKAVSVTRNKRIAVLGTRATINSGAYQRQIEQNLPGAYVKAIACPLLVPLVEEKFVGHPATKLIIKEYLAPVKQEGVDTILLGCTHYPLLHQLIREEVGDDIQIVDSASTCAEKVKLILNEKQQQKKDPSPQYRYFVSDDTEKFRLLGSEFLGRPIDQVRSSSGINLY